MANRSSFPTNVAITEQKQLDPKGQAITPVVKANSHSVQVFADYSIWDTSSNAFVKPEDTNVFAPK